MQKIVPNLWFDDQAEDAARLYTSLFEDAAIGEVSRYDATASQVAGRPEGSAMTVPFRLAGQEFLGLNGGPHFRFTPAISFFVALESETEVDALWRGLGEDGEVLMPLQRYPWSERYGWLNDRYGLSWQVMLAERGTGGPTITPTLMFVGEQHGRAEKAMASYTSLFPDSEITDLVRYGPEDGEPEGTVMYSRFSLHGQTFGAMDSALTHGFAFNESISFIVKCDSQQELDHFWESLSAYPEAEQCGWLKDRFGVSWQILPASVPKMLGDPDRNKAQRVMEVVMRMKKPDIAELERAYQGT